MQNKIESLLQYKDLVPTVKLISQQLLLLFNPNKEKYIYDLLNYLCHVQINNLIDKITLLNNFQHNQPLLLFASQLKINQEQNSLDKLIPFLKSEKQVEIGKQIENSINNCLDSLEKEEIANFIKSIRYKIGLDKFLADIIPTANQMGIELEELIDNFILTAFVEGDEHYMPLDKKILSEIMPNNKDKNLEFNDFKKVLNILTSSNFTWCLEKHDIEEIINLFNRIITSLKFINEQDVEYNNNQFINLLIISLSLKITDYADFNLNLLKAINSIPINNLSISPISFMFRIGDLLNQENIKLLKALLKQKDRNLFLKGAIIWKAILDAEESHSHISEKLTELLSEISLSPSIGKRVFQEYDSSRYIIGITLLTHSDYSIEKIQEQQQLLNWLINANSEAEEQGWSKFINKIAINDEDRLILSSFLEKILVVLKQ